MSLSETRLRAPDLPPGAGAKTGAGLVFLTTGLKAVALTAESTVVGRGDEVPLKIDDPDASRAHAEVVREGDRFAVRDLGSTNGTFVNGRRIKEGALEEGDLVRFGGTLAIFALENIAEFQGEAVPPEAAFVGGPRARPAWEGLKRVAGTDLRVLILGESGTGKELYAREIHRLSLRKGPFLALNCGAVPETLLEGTLFGHKKGAFTGAEQNRAGYFRDADGGTLFLDEVGEMAPTAQVKLLRVLQEGEVTPVGETVPIKVDVRVLAATNQELKELVKAGKFRKDLYARLKEYSVRLPRLSERREDIPPLIRALLARAGKPGLEASPEFLERMLLYPWPFNVRELDATIRKVVALHGDATELSLAHVPEELALPEGPETDAVAVDDEAPLRASLVKHRGNVSRVAEELSMTRQQVYRWVERSGIDVRKFR
ncbi:MAG: sigma 54-interacting transcriptional regulator [Deltaproteobacteria bacterium]|nr:sigma 54-interacting transcriptional regulator [Deltaproteobacteria bacterium]